MDLPPSVIPIQGDSDVASSVPFGGNSVVLLQCLFEVHRMFLADILDTEIVNDQSELYWSPLVFPEARNQFALMVTVLVEAFFQQFVGEETGLWQAVHALVGLNVD